MEKETQIRSTYVEMTPELAQKYLDTQVHNRPLSKAWVTALADSMKRGEWTEDGNSIKMDDAGHLIDGQHRLHAIIRSGRTIPMEVRSGFHRDALYIIDAFTKSRSVGDVLALNGIKSSRAVAAGITAYWLEKQGRSNHDVTKRVSPILAEQIYSESPDVWNRCVAFAKDKSTKRKDFLPLIPSGTLSGIIAYLVIEKKYDFDRVVFFFDQLCSANASQNVSIEKLRQLLLKDKFSKKHYSADVRRTYIVKTWNAYITGLPIRRLVIQKDEARVFFI